jgi:hypothetical protein
MIRQFRSHAAPGKVSCALLLCCAVFAGAVETKSWTHSGQPDFEKGTLENLSLSSEGRLMIAPVFREMADPSVAYLWALASDSKGTLYAGGGSPSAATSKLIAIDPAGKSRTLADLPGLQIQAIAVDRRDRVFVATAPDGKVYRVDAGGKFDVFYDPKAKYIWALAFNSRGDLFVATGDGGEIHRVTQDGKGSVFFRTEETHARSLAVDAKDNVIVGTEPGGLILRISPSGEGFVVYQAAKREVTTVAVDAAGVIYAAAVGNKSGGTSSPGSLSIPTPAVPPAQMSGAGGGAGAGRANAVQLQPSPLSPAPSAPQSVGGGSEVYRIGIDNYPQRIWTHATDIVYALGFDAQKRPILGTGNKGNIYRIDSDLVSTLLINAAPTQVTAFAAGPNGRLFAATGNVGKVYQVGPELQKAGTFESDALDAQYFSYWGRVRFKGVGGVRIETRTGNLDRPQKNWSAWAPLDQAARIASPSARFLQYRVTLEQSPQTPSPELREIELAYMAKNVAPTLDEIAVTPANYRFPAPTLPLSSSTNLTLPPLGQRRRPAGPALSLDASASGSQTMNYAKGSIGVRWLASDPNGDDLLFKVEIRGVQEQEWKLLRDNVKERVLSWESNTFPDGEYIVRVTATDSADNPPDQALSASIESERFVIDNTPPRIANLTGARAGAKLNVRWSAADERSVIRKAEYSVNGGEWVMVQPTTRLSDAPELHYDLSLDAQGGGTERTIAIRVTDEFDNQSVEKVVVR